jgi:hypothetical protein
MPVLDAPARWPRVVADGRNGACNKPASRRMTFQPSLLQVATGSSSSAGSAFVSVGFVLLLRPPRDNIRIFVVDARQSPEESQQLLHGPLKISSGCYRSKIK